MQHRCTIYVAVANGAHLLNKPHGKLICIGLRHEMVENSRSEIDIRNATRRVVITGDVFWKIPGM
ncbi:MAG: hypothetical protein MPJ50_04130 [Pirellulales bacterium]|nr:hypothetical protein [Pirellulales bacterium]